MIRLTPTTDPLVDMVITDPLVDVSSQLALPALPALPATVSVPQVKVIEDGKEVVRPDVLAAVVQLGSLAQLSKIRQSLEKEEFEGQLDPRIIDATGVLQFMDLVNDHPHKPWISASIFNDGPNTVRLAVNREYNWVSLNKNESIILNFAKAGHRIEIMHYQCAEGETASVRVVGKW